jgi:hypothetical protein
MHGYHALDDDWASSFRDSGRHWLRWLHTVDGPLSWSGEEAVDVLRFALAACEQRLRRSRREPPGAQIDSPGLPQIAHVLLVLRCARKGNSGMAAGLGRKLTHSTRQHGKQLIWDQRPASYLNESWSLVR